MLEALGAEILSLVAKEVAKQSPAIAEEIIRQLGEIGMVLYKYMYPDEVKGGQHAIEESKE